MTILVSDTSVLIDLERGKLIASAFKLSATFAVPDLLYERELRDYGGEELVKLGLKVQLIIPADGIQGFQSIEDTHSSPTWTGLWPDRGQFAA